MFVISTSDLLGSDWNFLESSCKNPKLRWETHSGLPRNSLERRVRHPVLGRYRCALSAVQSAREQEQAVLVSHLPRMAEATNILRRRFAPHVPQIAFAFTFTSLPGPRRTAILSRTLNEIDEFVVFARFEIELYAHHFGIASERIRFLPWAMEPPLVGPINPVADFGDYLCAIGSEGRDYNLLAEAMRRLPDIKMAIVPRAHAIRGISFPPNVRVFTEMAPEAIWRLASDSKGMILPLESSETACGHVTMVAAQHLGVPLAVTASKSVNGYATDNLDAIVFAPKSLEALIEAIRRLHDDQAQAQELATAAKLRAANANSTANWVHYFTEFGHRYRLLAA